MQYMLLIYDSEATWNGLPEDERNAYFGEYMAYTKELRDQGKLIAGDQLQPIATATSVSVRSGETIVTDGPFAETKETLGGYYLIDVDSLDDALAWAAKVPSARLGRIEVRPLVMHPAGVTG